MAVGERGYFATIRYPDTRDELARLAAMAKALDPYTRDRLQGVLGARPLASALEVGPGSGSVARWLGETYDPDQLVVLDNDRALLNRLEAPFVQLVHGDVTDPDLPRPGTFDLIHARCVLECVPDPEKVLERLASWLRPQGWLVVSDLVPSVDLCREPELARTTPAVWAALCRAMGSDPEWGNSLPEPLARAGLRKPGIAVDVPILTGRDGLGTMMAMTTRRLRDDVLSLPEAPSEEELEATVERLRQDLGVLTPAPVAMVTAWGQAD